MKKLIRILMILGIFMFSSVNVFANSEVLYEGNTKSGSVFEMNINNTKIPVYCLDHDYNQPTQGSKYKKINYDKKYLHNKDNEIAILLKYGYPNNKNIFKEFGLTDEEAQSAVQHLLWEFIDNNAGGYGNSNVERYKNKLYEIVKKENTNFDNNDLNNLKIFVHKEGGKLVNGKTEWQNLIMYENTPKEPGIHGITPNLPGLEGENNKPSLPGEHGEAGKPEEPGTHGTTPNLPGLEGENNKPSLPGEHGEAGKPEEIKSNIKIPKTGDFGTLGFSILGALSLVGLSTLNKSKFE